MLSDTQAKSLDEYLEFLNNKYQYDNPDINKIYPSDYITGMRDCIELIKHKLKGFKTFNIINNTKTNIKEEEIVDILSNAFNEFIKLESQHPDELRDFADGIHKCQYVLGMRIAREHCPDIFPIK